MKLTERSNKRHLRALISLVRSDEEPPRQLHAVQIAALFAAALFMENLDSTIIVTALPQMARSFDATPVGLNIGVAAYTLTLAVVIPIGG
jgi:MFS family permease